MVIPLPFDIVVGQLSVNVISEVADGIMTLELADIPFAFPVFESPFSSVIVSPKLYESLPFIMTLYGNTIESVPSSDLVFPFLNVNLTPFGEESEEGFVRMNM